MNISVNTFALYASLSYYMMVLSTGNFEFKLAEGEGSSTNDDEPEQPSKSTTVTLSKGSLDFSLHLTSFVLIESNTYYNCGNCISLLSISSLKRASGFGLLLATSHS